MTVAPENRSTDHSTATGARQLRNRINHPTGSIQERPRSSNPANLIDIDSVKKPWRALGKLVTIPK